MKLQFSLGDSRLNKRILKCIEMLSEKPSASFPELFEDSADLAGFHRLVNNSKTDWNDILCGIYESTLDPCLQESEILTIHDTTPIEPQSKSKSVKGFGLLSNKNKYGFFSHVSLMISVEKPVVFGVGEASFWTRNQDVTLLIEPVIWIVSDS